MFRIIFLLFLLLFHFHPSPLVKHMQRVTIQKDMQLTSTVFTNNDPLPIIYTCKGQGINPPLVFSDVPEKTKSFVMIMNDPDAVHGDFIHWVIFDIPSNVRTIAQNSYPTGSVQALNSAGQNGYTAACPPDGTGTHRYIFTLYAIDTVLTLTTNMQAEDIKQAMTGHILSQTSLTGLFPPK